jgi:hypothetical protein
MEPKPEQKSRLAT